MDSGVSSPTTTQIEAAQELQSHLASWKTAEEALDSIAARYPDHDHISTLVKVATVNALYSTNAYSVHAMAEHVCTVLTDLPPHRCGFETVERMAELQVGSEETHNRKTKRFVSFASKFAHFFMDKDRFFIYDSYAVKALDHFLGTNYFHAERVIPYTRYADEIQRLITKARLHVSAREIDRFLWTVGQYLRRTEPGGGKEIKALFEGKYPHLVPILSRALGNLIQV